jgi:hypothetical protein
MWVLILLVPVQLVAGWWQKHLDADALPLCLQHLPAFPVCAGHFRAAFCLALAYLWERHKTLLRCLTVVMGVYVIASASFLAIRPLRRLCGAVFSAEDAGAQDWIAGCQFRGARRWESWPRSWSSALYYGIAKTQHQPDR